MTDKIAKNRLRNLRLVGVAEGISYLVLLFIAMPLKYFADMPEVVKFTGWVHGVLFIWFVFALILTQYTFRWSLLKAGVAFLASLIPFGTFVLDKQLRKEERSLFIP